MEIIIGLVVLVVGLSSGRKIADIDLKLQKLNLMNHRSALTHGFIFPLVLFSLTTAWGNDLLDQVFENNAFDPIYRDLTLKYFISGFCITYAIHLAFDMYPKKWHGNAKVVFLGARAPGLLSWFWLGIGAVTSVVVVLLLLESDWEWMVAAGLMLFFFFEMGRWQKTLWPLLTLAGVVWLSFVLWPILVGLV